MTSDADRAYAERLATDYIFFIEELWRDRGLDAVAPLGDVERDICRWVSRPEKPQRVVLAFRGIGKTHFGTACYSCWRLLRDRETKVLIVSKSQGHAKDTVGLIRDWLTHVPFLAHLNPALDPSKQDQACQFSVAGCSDSRTPSVAAKGIEGMITGTRAHVLIADDVETPENTKTLAARDELNRKVSEFDAIASYGEKEIVYFGTYHHEESLYLKLNTRGYAARSWPFTYPSPTERVLNMAPLLMARLESGVAKPGDLTCPHRFAQEDIVRKKAEGWTYWVMQYQLVSDLASGNRYPLRLSDLVVMDVARDNAPVSAMYGVQDHNGSTAITDILSIGFGQDRLFRPAKLSQEWAPYTGTKMAIDPSGRGEDSTGVSIVSHLAGTLWCHLCTGFPGGSTSEAMDAIAATAFEYRVRDIYIEDNFGRGMWQQLFEPILRRHYLEPDPRREECPEGWKCSVTSVNAVGQKETRIIDTLEPVVSTHRLVMDRKSAANQTIQYQLTRITRQRGALPHEDEIDSLALCVKQWQHVMTLDQGRAAGRAKERLIDDALKEHRRAAGLRVREPRWFRHGAA